MYEMRIIKIINNGEELYLEVDDQQYGILEFLNRRNIIDLEDINIEKFD